MKRILVALDDSPRAPSVFAAAAELARMGNAKLVLLRAVGLPIVDPQAGPYPRSRGGGLATSPRVLRGACR